MRSLHKHLSLLFLSIFLLGSLIVTPSVNASSVVGQLLTPPKTLFDYGKEYCDKRSGDLMNLETWYSGKCAPGTDTLSGQGVGFSDIILLQGIEYIIGPQYHNFFDLIINLLKGLEAAKNLNLGKSSPEDIELLASIESSQGILPILGKVSAGLITTKPASTNDYLAYVSNNLRKKHIINEAIAAGPGYGFQALSPILPLWRAFRNVAYLLFALGFVLYGVMIMLRIRIDSKTAATIQLAIPKLVVTLLLITFSYAIVGLLIDISTVVTALMINILRAGGILTFDKHMFIDLASGSSFGALGSMAINTFMAVLVSPFIVFNLLIGGATGAIIAAIVGGVSVLIPQAGFFGMIIILFILIAIIISYTKLIMKLFQAFFSIIINLIFSPIILLGNLFPGTDAFGSWLRSIYGNLAVFPVASFFLVLSYALMAQPILSISGIGIAGISPQGIVEEILGVKALSSVENIWTPPMTIPGASMNPSVTLPGITIQAQSGTLFGSMGSLMLATIGFGLLLMASKYVEMVEKALKVPPFPYGAAIGEALKGGWTGAGTIAPSIGGADWYKRASRATGIKAGTPYSAPLTPPAATTST